MVRSPPPIVRPDANDAGWQHWVAALVAALAALALYARTLGHEFVDVDLAAYITENRPVLGGLTWEGFRWAWTSYHAANWHPLTWLSHMLDVQLFGLEPAGHLAHNALLHALSSGLVVLVLARATGALGPSLACGLLFAVHPLHVESVAWASERKDVLSAVLALLSLWAWLGWAQRGSRVAWVAALVLYAAGLAAKPMLVTLPFVMMLLDVWPLGRLRWRRLGRGGWGLRYAPILEKLPFFALAIASCWVTWKAQSLGRAVLSLERLPLHLRLGNAVKSWATYLRRAFWPDDLCFNHGFDLNSVTLTAVLGSAAVLAAVSALAWWQRRSRPWTFVGWCGFLGMLVPVIGIVQVGSQAMADRYMYLPLIPLSIAVVWSAREFVTGPVARIALLSAALAAYASVAWFLVGTWRDSETLAKRGIDVEPVNPVAHDLYAYGLSLRGDLQGALKHREFALRVAPENIFTRDNLAVTLFQLGRYEDAERELRIVLGVRPDLAKPHGNLGGVLLQLGKFAEARAHLKISTRLSPGVCETWAQLGYVCERLGDPAGARAAYQEALTFQPPDVRALAGLARLAVENGDAAAAAALLESAIAIAPRDEQSRLQRAELARLAGRETAALADLKVAREANPTWPQPLLEMGWIFVTARDDALADPVQALAIADAFTGLRGPSDPEALDLRAAALARSGRFEEAAAAARAAAESARAAGQAEYAARIEGRVQLYAQSRFQRGGRR